MGKLHARQKQHQRQLAFRLMGQYFRSGRRLFPDSELLSQRLTAISLGFSSRYRVPLSPEMRRIICKRCHVLLVPGRNCRVRMHYPNVVATCMACGNYNKYGYAKKQ